MSEMKWSFHSGGDVVSVACEGYCRFDVLGPIQDRVRIATEITNTMNSHASLVEENEILKLKLRGAVDDAEHWAGKWGMDTIRLEEENKRMREALEEVATGDWNNVHWVRSMAAEVIGDTNA